jgi:hypothetical protein
MVEEVMRAASDDLAIRAQAFISAQITVYAAAAGMMMSSLAGDFRRIADALRSSETIRGSSRVADRSADLLDRAGTYLQSAGGEQIIAAAGRLTHQHKWVIASVALATGFATSRGLKVVTAGRDRAEGISEPGSHVV